MTEQTPVAGTKSDHPLVGTVIAGKYDVLSVLGQGGAGEVLLAEQRQLSRKVAVKILRSDLSAPTRAEFQQRFLREAARAGQLSHANVVTVHDFGAEPDGTLYQVMEYIDGRPLDRIVRKGPLPTDIALEIAEGVACGLRHAHARGLVHRDIKPANVLLTKNDEGGYRAKIVDFGLVRAEDDVGMTSQGMVMGTPAYLSPEQANSSEDVTDRSDVYSFGCMLYEVFTGSRPYSGKSSLQVVMQHMSAPYPEMAERGFDVDGRLQALVRRCMAKDPALRPSAEQLVEEIRILRTAFSNEVPSEPAYLERVTADIAPTEVISVGTTAPTLVSRPDEPPAAPDEQAPSILGRLLRLMGAGLILFVGTVLLAVVLVGSYFFLGPELLEEGGEVESGEEVAAEPGVGVGSGSPASAGPEVELAPATGSANPWAVQPGAEAEPEAAPAVEPAEKPATAPPTDLNPIMVRGEAFVGHEKAAALELCNTVNQSKLESLGLTPRLAAQIVDARPIASLKDVAYLSAMTPKQAKALHAAVQ